MEVKGFNPENVPAEIADDCELPLDALFQNTFASVSDFHHINKNMPNLFIVSGCNGAGKTTASYTVLPEILGCEEFVNADEIAKGLSPFNPKGVAIDAGRVMLMRMDSLIKQKQTFSIETTHAIKMYEKLVQNVQKQGYAVSLIYFWLKSPELAMQRVATRVASGGHDIPVDTIFRRYESGINNLFNIYLPLVDYCLIVDNSSSPSVLVAEKRKDEDIKIYNQAIFNEMQSHVKQEE